MTHLTTIVALVLTVVFVLLFRLLLLLPLALGLTLVRPLATNLANFHRLRGILPETGEHSRQQHEPLHTGCGLGAAGSVAVVPGPS